MATYKDFAKEELMKAMKPFIGTITVTPENMRLMKQAVEGVVERLTSDANIPIPETRLSYVPPDHISITFNPEEY